MAFGKRKPQEAGVSAATGSTGKVPLTSANFLERTTTLKEHVERVLHQASVLAGSIKESERIDATSFGAGNDPLNHPIPIAGFSRHFNFVRDGKLQHGVFAFLRAGDAVDATAQLYFFELATTAARLNALCWMAHEEGALTMALQSQTARGDVDRIVVLAGFLAGVLDNLIAAELSMKSSGKRISADDARGKLVGWGQRSMRAMIDPANFDALLPKVEWPVWGVEMVVEDHIGQLVVNEVYLPKELANPVRATIVREQSRAAA